MGNQGNGEGVIGREKENNNTYRGDRNAFNGDINNGTENYASRQNDGSGNGIYICSFLSSCIYVHIYVYIYILQV
jgi:hypothetical protein